MKAKKEERYVSPRIEKAAIEKLILKISVLKQNLNLMSEHTRLKVNAFTRSALTGKLVREYKSKSGLDINVTEYLELLHTACERAANQIEDTRKPKEPNFDWELMLAESYVDIGGKVIASENGKFAQLLQIFREKSGVEFSKNPGAIKQQIKRIQQAMKEKDRP